MTALIAAVISFAFMSCNKENELQPTEKTEDQIVLHKILDFKNSVENPDNLKSEQTMSIDSAVWYIEAALNYTYCMTENPEMYENAEIITDSIVIDLNVENNDVAYQSVIYSYESFNIFLNQNLENQDYSWKKYYVTDIEYKNNKLACKYLLYVKNMTKAGVPISLLDYDWKTGAGGCDAGTCDGQYLNWDAGKALTSVLNKVVAIQSFYTDIHPGIQYLPDVYPLNGSDTLLYFELFPYYFPCIYENTMNELYTNATILEARYTKPAGYSKMYSKYEFWCKPENGYHRYGSIFVIVIGKKIES